MTHSVMLVEPPRLCQFQLYKGTEGMFGCWATAAEMIVKWRVRSSFFSRPQFENLLERGLEAEYLNFILDWLPAWGFEGQKKGAFTEWTPALFAGVLRSDGPMLAIGNLGGNGDGASGGSPSIGGSAHAVAVFGIEDEKLHYVDPWDAGIKQINWKVFVGKLWKSWSSLQTRTPNRIPWAVQTYTGPTYFQVR